MTAANKIEVHIKRPIIKCTPKGGHVHGGRTEQLRWVSSDAPFTLLVTDLDTGGATWPFVEAQPTWPVTDTKLLTLRADIEIPVYFKYTVKADGCADLDPIIIVDR